jgi:hypothetical protein
VREIFTTDFLLRTPGIAGFFLSSMLSLADPTTSIRSLAAECLSPETRARHVILVTTKPTGDFMADAPEDMEATIRRQFSYLDNPDNWPERKK